MTRPLRAGLVGFGTSGRVFHAPFLACDPRFSLDVVVTSDPGRQAEVAVLHPAAAVEDAPDALASYDLDLVVLGTPPGTHLALATGALDRGCAVVVDKPLAVTAADGRAMVQAAQAAGVPLTVFQNRRWDADVCTLQGLLARGALGQVRRFESRFEVWKEREAKAWKAGAAPQQGGGVLYDLGAHLLDQALQLFGPVEHVHAELTAHRQESAADDDAFVSLRHASGVRSHLWMSTTAAQSGPRFRVLGSAAAWTSYGLDGQEAALKAGGRPTDDGFGEVPPERWGVLGRDGELERVPSERGDYAAFYRQLALALTGGGPLPVDPRDAVAVLEIVEQVHRTTPVQRPLPVHGAGAGRGPDLR